MKKNLKIVSICIILVLSSFLVGLGFKKPPLVLDTRKNIVYQNINADNIIDDFVGKPDEAKSIYKDNYYSVSGIITEKKGNNKQFALAGVETTSDKKIRCVTSDKSIVDLVSKCNVGDVVNVYGKLYVDVIDKDVEIEIDNIVVSDVTRPITSYSTCAPVKLYQGPGINY